MHKTSFDCVDFQRKERDKASKDANFDFRNLIEQVNERTKKNELNNYIESLKEKQFTNTQV
jgi:hypothetical protein